MPTSFSPSGAGGHSRAAAGVFNSRAWLDKPLPTARALWRHTLAAAEPMLSAAAWACIEAKARLEDEQATREGKYP